MYAKVFSSIFDGSMRGHSDLILVFVNCLCHADQDGIVDRTCVAIADETGLSIRRVEVAVALLESPDDQSRSRNDDGRRLNRIDPERAWGWEIVNFRHYNDIRNATERREYMRNFMREKRKGKVLAPVSTVLAPVSNVSLLSASVSTSIKNSSPTVMEFDQFWKAYPKKIGKGAARKAFEKCKCAGRIAVILNAIRQQIGSEQWNKDYGQFIPYPATWLNQERWEDETNITIKPVHPVANKKREYESAVWHLCQALREQKKTALNPEDKQRAIDGLRDKYRDVPGALKEALKIVSA